MYIYTCKPVVTLAFLARTALAFSAAGVGENYLIAHLTTQHNTTAWVALAGSFADINTRALCVWCVGEGGMGFELLMPMYICRCCCSVISFSPFLPVFFFLFFMSLVCCLSNAV